ncbi:amidohydrolase family protein [Streptomyces sp. HNM0574]|uniref:amidohydrolase family protein n=1 Tax=Streptomyces sp. HNM0574 TaxID=2714954 RepID=UPI00146B5DE4|nr:amidohydrolase family protein [Streptomyces sp. HNM0574]NLU67204.1 amidohydrolase family protein [Streptomyces sp. HNM0574]
MGRRGFLRDVGLTGAGVLGASVAGGGSAAAAPAEPAPTGHARGAGGERRLGPGDFGGERQLLLPEVVLLPDGPRRGQGVLVEKGRFREVGDADRLTARHPNLRPVRMDGKLLMPGFVDAHHHLTQSFGKAQAFGQPSEIFKSVWEPLEHALDEKSAYLSAKLASLEALRGGFTTVADAGTRAPVDVEVVARGAEEAGIRCVLARVVSDGKGGEEHLGRWDGNPLIHPSLAIPVPEDATAAVHRKTAKLCAEADAVLQVHVNEHLASVERSLKSTGRRPLEYLHHIGALGPHTLGAHGTLLTPAEMRMLADSGAALSYNPVASSWKGNAVTHATMLDAMGVRFGTGTDGTRGDGFRLVDAAETAQRLAYGIASGDSVCGAGRMWLRHATSLSADALGLGKVTGEIAEGRAADYLVVDLRVPELTPSTDLEWELVRFGNRDLITAVVVAGRLRLWEGNPRDWDASALVDEVASLAPEVVRRADIDRVEPR